VAFHDLSLSVFVVSCIDNITEESSKGSKAVHCPGVNQFTATSFAPEDDHTIDSRALCTGPESSVGALARGSDRRGDVALRAGKQITLERWRHLESLFCGARSSAPRERDSFLAQVCDDELRKEVEIFIV
jgi:hypothetical protein